MAVCPSYAPKIERLADGARQAMVLLAVAELGAFEALARGPATAAALAGQLGADAARFVRRERPRSGTERLEDRRNSPGCRASIRTGLEVEPPAAPVRDQAAAKTLCAWQFRDDGHGNQLPARFLAGSRLGAASTHPGGGLHDSSCTIRAGLAHPRQAGGPTYLSIVEDLAAGG